MDYNGWKELGIQERKDRAGGNTMTEDRKEDSIWVTMDGKSWGYKREITGLVETP